MVYQLTLSFIYSVIRMLRNESLYKLLLIGDSNVGKSGIQQQYVGDQFLSTTPTIGMYVYQCISTMYVVHMYMCVNVRIDLL